MPKTVLFVSSRFPFPVNGGREKTLVEYLSFLDNERVDVHFIFFSSSNKSEPVEDLRKKFQCIKSIIKLERPTFFTSIKNVLVRSFLLRDWSIQESFFYSKSSDALIYRYINEFRPDVVFFDMIRTAPYFYEKGYEKHCRLVFDMDDLLSKRYHILQSENRVNILGDFEKNLPRFVSFLANKVLKSLILGFEGHIVFRNEKKYSQFFDSTLLVSPVERDALRSLVHKPEKVVSLFPSVTLNKLEHLDSESKTIAFMGLLNVPHNKDALLKFLNDIYPKILKENGDDLSFIVVGGGADEEILSYAKRYPSVNFLGFVADYTSVLKSVDVFVAPVYFGTGIKLKILDAIGMGLPVVTTRVGAEGLLLENDVNACIADEPDKFAQAVVDLLQDVEKRRALSRNAFIYAEKYHNYDILQADFLSFLGLNNDS